MDLYKWRRKISYQKPIPIDARAPVGSPWQSQRDCFVASPLANDNEEDRKLEGIPNVIRLSTLFAKSFLSFIIFNTPFQIGVMRYV
jgi:hypothetical protein